jgi:hypothetical protein
MARTETILQLFVGSPNDVSEERTLLEEVVTELNLTWRQKLGLSVELIKWETHANPGLGIDAQDVINTCIGEEYDIFIGIMWGRFGSPTSRHESGTEEEYRRAYGRWEKDKSSIKIMFYFSEAGISPTNIDYNQIKKIKEFKEKLGPEGNLYWNYRDPANFQDLVRMHLSRAIQNWHSPEWHVIKTLFVEIRKTESQSWFS